MPEGCACPVVALILAPARRRDPARNDGSPQGYCQLQTNKGNINVEVRCDVVPRMAENFLGLCAKGYYDGTKFHRSIKNFMIQVFIGVNKRLGNSCRGELPSPLTYPAFRERRPESGGALLRRRGRCGGVISRREFHPLDVVTSRAVPRQCGSGPKPRGSVGALVGPVDRHPGMRGNQGDFMLCVEKPVVETRAFCSCASATT